jgi:hypothetical protein
VSCAGGWSGRRDQSDEELAEEDDLTSADLLAVDREDWPRLVTQLEALYRVGELHGLGAAKVWLAEHGITWRELVQAPRRPLLRRAVRAPRPTRPPGHQPRRIGELAQAALVLTRIENVQLRHSC